MEKYIIHVPHSSLKIPRCFQKRLMVDSKYFEKENQFISDFLIDQFLPPNFSNVVKFSYSRMFCDVERYLDDSKEEMSKYGMGAIYERDSNQREFVRLDSFYKKYVIEYYYKKHHQELDQMVEQVFNVYSDCFIIDLHSFSDEFVYKMFHKRDNPDICIGINQENFDKDLLKKTIRHFHSYGYSVMVNYPYSGSIISNRYPNVKSIMIEVNKKVYSNDSLFHQFYQCMMKYYDVL